jgi:RNAse (barnase) inhibitor barstar
MLHAMHLYSYVGICASYLGNTHDLTFGALNNLDALWEVVCDLMDELPRYLFANAALKLHLFHNWISSNSQ